MGEFNSRMNSVDIIEEGLKFSIRFSPEEKDVIYVPFPEGLEDGYGTVVYDLVF